MESNDIPDITCEDKQLRIYLNNTEDGQRRKEESGQKETDMCKGK